MSAEATTFVFKHSPYRATDRLVHLAIADVVNDGYENRFWMTQKRVAAKAKCSRQTVNVAVAKMVKDGYLTVVENPGGHRPNVYQFVMSEVSGIKTPETDGVGYQDTELSNLRTPDPSSPITITKQEQDTDSNESDAVRNTTPPSKPAKPRATKTRDYSKNANAYTDIENAIWNAYPKHPHPNKALTIRHVRGWMAEDADAGQAILAAAQVYAADAASADFEFIRRAHNFFDPANEKCNWREFAERAVEPTAEWKPTVDDLRRAVIWDDFEMAGFWTDADGNTHDELPAMVGVDRPQDPRTPQTHIDAKGLSYKLDFNAMGLAARKYLQDATIPKNLPVSAPQTVWVGDSATSANFDLRNDLSVRSEGARVN